MTNTRIRPSTSVLTDQDSPQSVAPQRRERTAFDDEIARLIRNRVQTDLAKRQDRRRRYRQGRNALEQRPRYAEQALHAEKLAARAQQVCECAQPRPPALLERDPGGGAAVLTICPVCGRRA